MKRLSLIILFSLSAMAGNAVAENFESLDAVTHLSSFFEKSNKKHRHERTHCQHEGKKQRAHDRKYHRRGEHRRIPDRRRRR